MYNNLIYKKLGGNGKKMKICKLCFIIMCMLSLYGCGAKEHIQVIQEVKQNQQGLPEQQDDRNQKTEKSIPYDREGSCLYIWEEKKDNKLLEHDLELAENISQQAHKFEQTEVILLNERTNYPSVVDRKNTPIKRAIDAYARRVMEESNASVKEYVQWASEELAIRQGTAGNITKDSFNPYEYSQDFVVTRNDDKMITFVNDVYTYTGGAHPNRYKKVDSYNSKTGKLVTIDSITSNKKAFYSYVTKALNDYVTANNCSEYLFREGEYREVFNKWDNNWWIRNGYLYVGFNTYDIAPYVAGPLVIPIDVDSAKEYLNGYGLSLFE